MVSNTINQSFVRKQCFDKAEELIQRVIDIKTMWPDGFGFACVIEDPKFRSIVRNLDIWTDMLVAKEGGL